MAIAKVLLVDDDDNVRFGLGELLESKGFEITTAASVPEALKLIISETYDVLLSDLHMPGAGDGLTVVSAMRHANPRAVTLLLTAYPEMSAATHAILLQADQILQIHGSVYLEPISEAAHGDFRGKFEVRGRNSLPISVEAVHRPLPRGSEIELVVSRGVGRLDEGFEARVLP